MRLDSPLRLKRQTTVSSPAAGLDAVASDANGKIVAVDPNGVKNYLTKYTKPDYWQTFGHSYFQFLFGTFYQSGRADALLRAALDIETGNWRNWAVNGASVIQEGNWRGGWARVMQEVVKPQRAAPYVSDGGATLLCYGINDIGGFSGLSQAQAQALVTHALRAVISRCRASVYFDNGFSVGTRTTYGAGWTAFSTGVADYSSSAGTLRRATSTTSATITLTLPSDYTGQAVVPQFIAEAAVGGTVTFSGTAGVTGTLSTLSQVPSGGGVKTPVVRRITNLTSANAGQTIVMTLSSVTTQMLFDGWWLEADYPPPVIVSNAARVLTAGYAGYANAIGDTDIANLNANSIVPVVAEFTDGMVQLADMDAALNKTTDRFGADGLHPNERGAGYIAQSYQDAIDRLVPTIAAAPTLNMNVSSPRAGYVRRPRISGFWYGPEGQEATADIVPVAGDIRWAPFIVTEGRERYPRAGIRLAAGGSVAGTIRWGVYSDIAWRGYPGSLIAEIPNVGGAAFSVGTTAGVVNNPASGTGSISWELDPGLYWLALKFETTGTGQAYECLTGPDTHNIMPQLNGDLSGLERPICFVQGGWASGALPNQFDPTLGLFPNSTFPKFALQVA